MSSAARKFHLSLLDTETLLDPTPVYQRLREEEPVHWSEVLRGWILSRHEDVLDGLRDPRLLVSREEDLAVRLRGTSLEGMGAWRQVLAAYPCDGREAAPLRWQAAPAFTPPVLEGWHPAIRGIVARLVRRGIATGRMDAIRAVCAPLPALVLAEVFGLPEQDRETFLSWARHLSDFHSPVSGADREALARGALGATRELLAYLEPLLEERSRSPGTDLLSRMLQVAPQEARTPRRVATLALMLVSGLGAVTDQLGNGLHELLLHPGQKRMLRLDRSRMRPCVEETLRFQPAQPLLRRTVGETLSLRGRTLHKGETVFLNAAAANRDPRVFMDPERFEPTRDSARQKHLTFGFGLHHRLDAGLIRHEMEALFEVLLEELPGLHLDEERLPRLKCHSPLARGIEMLPVRG